MTEVIVKILHPFKYPGLKVITSEQTKDSFINRPPCLLAEIAQVACLVGRPRKCYIVCVRPCDQKPYLHNETKGGICIKREFNSQKNISLLQNGRRFFVYSSNMAPVTSCEHTLLPSTDNRYLFAAFLFKRNKLPLFNWIVSGRCFSRDGLLVQLNFSTSELIVVSSDLL